MRFIAGSAVALMVAAAMGIGGSPARAQEHVKIGVVSATTGPFAAPGKFQLNGFNLAAEDINGRGGF